VFEWSVSSVFEDTTGKEPRITVFRSNIIMKEAAAIWKNSWFGLLKW